MRLFAMVNPANKAGTPPDVARYRAEPYVVAGDVYSNPAHRGRGGWTWYTGSAGWMYRVAIQGLLGLNLKRGALQVDPCIPQHWAGFEVVLSTPQGHVQVVVENPEKVTRGVRRLELDGVEVQSEVALADLAGPHVLRVVLGQ
jgi:cyclic beta-1,2-glucan synthetase